MFELAFAYLRDVSLALFSYLPSGLKLAAYSILGADIGKNVVLGLGSYILPLDFRFKNVHISNGCIIRGKVRICAKALYLGKNTEIKENTKIWGQSIFRMDEGAYVDQNTLIDLRCDVILGKYSSVGAGSYIYTHGVWHSVLDGNPFSFGPVDIQDRAWVAANVFIMPGVTVGKDAVVGARSLVLKDVPPDTLVAGNPAKEIRKGVRKQLTLEEKNKIVIDTLKSFAKLKDASDVVEAPDGISFTVSSRKGKQSLVYAKKRKKDIIGNLRPKSLLLSLDFPSELKDACEKNVIEWIDLGKSEAHCKNKELISFLSNYGIHLDSSVGCSI